MRPPETLNPASSTNPPEGAAGDTDKQHKYKAFISYSHAADGRLAPRLQSGLQRFAKPWYWLRSMRIFRDETSLSNTPELWPTIESALSQSEYFILLASPQAAMSLWVQKEIEYWVSNRSLTKLLIVLTDGDIVWDHASQDFDWSKTTALPRGASLRFKSEPKYSDLRKIPPALQASLEHPAFQAVLADIASTLLSRDKDELIGEDVAQHKRTKKLAWSAVSLLALLTIVSIVGIIFAVRGQQEARRQAQIAQQNAETAQAESERSRRALYLDRVGRARFEVQEGRNARAQELLARCPIDLRHWEWRYLWSQTVASNPPMLQIFEASADSDVTRFAISGDSRLLAVGTDDGVLTVWDLEERVLRHRFSAHDKRITSVAFDRNAGRIVTGGSDHVIRVWDVVSGTNLTTLTGHEGGILAVGFGPGSNSIVSVGSGYRLTAEMDIEPLDNTIRLWSLSTGEATQVTRKPEPMAGLSTTVFRLAAVSSTGNILATSSYEAGGGASVQRWLVGDDRPMGYYGELHRNMTSSTALALSGDGATFASAGEDGTVVLVNTLEAEPSTTRLLGHRDRVLSVALSTDGRRIVSSGADSTIRLWDSASGEEIVALREDLGPFQQVALGPDARRLIGASGGNIAVWETPNISEFTTIRPTHGRARYAELSVVGDRLMHMPWDGKSIEIWDLTTSSRLSTLREDDEAIRDFAVDATGRWLVSHHAFGDLTLWDTGSGRAIKKRNYVVLDVSNIALSPDGERFALVTEGEVSIWDTERLKRLDRMPAHPESSGIVLYGPNNDRLIVPGDMPDSVRLLDAKTAQHIETLRGGASVGAFSSDGKRIATGGLDGEIRVWDAFNGKQISSLHGHSDSVTDLAFSEDQTRIISGSHDNTVRLWDADTGDELLVIATDKPSITQVAFLQKHSYLSAVVGDRLHIWNIDGERPEETFIPEATPNFGYGLLAADWFIRSGESNVVAYPLDRIIHE